MTGRRLTRRLALGATASLCWSLAPACALFYYQQHRANAAVQHVSLPPTRGATPRSRILVVAPHSDDETLGVGGYMAQAARAGARVRVAILTNGDGFPLAASRAYRRILPLPGTYIRLAYLRQDETTAALSELGLPPGAVRFLGYPDGGLHELWTRHWAASEPYTSRFTGCSSSPYGNSFTSGALYCGESLLGDLVRILEHERPTDLFLPDPGDDHPDHWAAYCFASAALEVIRAREERASTPHSHGRWADRTQVRTYLIHRGAWPVPQGLREDARLVPPASLLNLDTSWVQTPLAEADRARKRAAILRYRSQTAVMRRFLTSFIRRDEVFGTLPPAVILPGRVLERDATGLPVQWAGDSRQLRDAARDTLIRRIDGAADLKALDACSDGDRLYLRLSARSALSGRMQYRVHLHSVGEPGSASAPVTVRLGSETGEVTGLRSQKRDGDWWLSVPRRAFGGSTRVLVSAEARLGRVVLDRISWRVLVLPPPGRAEG